MFFYLAKVIGFLLQPSTLIALLIGYGSILIWTGWARWGRRFATFGAILLLLAGLSPLGNALILRSRTGFGAPDARPRAYHSYGAGDGLSARGGAGTERGFERCRAGSCPAATPEKCLRAAMPHLYRPKQARGAETLLTALGAARQAHRGEVVRHVRERGLPQDASRSGD
jgi:hypothetical protein